MQNKFPSKIFIDGGDPMETDEIKHLLGFLDGQTTNPTLIAKNLKSKQSTVNSQQKITEEQALDEYRKIVQAMNKTIHGGSISIQVFANHDTTSEEMLIQARERRLWISNASIKFPCTKEGLEAVSIACREMPVNVTLVFSQSQAAAVYEATRGAQYPVFLSPFVGRLDDREENGMELIYNILQMYKAGDGHVEVLTASVRSLDHLLYALQLKSNIITSPFKILKEWKERKMVIPKESYVYPVKNLKPIPFDKKVTLGKKWEEYNLQHDLTDKGVAAFWSDWMNIF